MLGLLLGTELGKSDGRPLGLFGGMKLSCAVDVLGGWVGLLLGTLLGCRLGVPLGKRVGAKLSISELVSCVLGRLDGWSLGAS